MADDVCAMPGSLDWHLPIQLKLCEACDIKKNAPRDELGARGPERRRTVGVGPAENVSEYSLWVNLQMPTVKQPADGCTVRLFPDFAAFIFAQLVALVDLVMATHTQRCDTVVVGLDGPPLPVSQLVGMRGHHGPVLGSTVLARRLTHYLQQLLVAIHHLRSMSI